jgi:hypothetical protein
VDEARRLIDEFGLPGWALVVLLGLLILARLWPLLGAAGRGFVRVGKGLRALPILRRHSAAARRRRIRRQQFADYVEARIRELDSREEWNDYRFAELEAEVEVEQGAGWDKPLRRFLSQGKRLRRERSLSKALRNSRQRLILLQGDPGAGKSVALRHVARRNAAQARRSRRLNVQIPLYVNLKMLERGNSSVDARLIERYVRAALSEGATSDVDRFLEDEFLRGVREGTWLFLFDSFDEIPEVLSSTEVDETVRAYSDAIYGFLHGMNSCRAVVASRYFRAPPGYGWPVFRILGLSQRRQHRLVGKAGLSAADEKILRGSLPSASARLSTLAENPLFLGLLCEYVREKSEFPTNPHAVIESYIDSRFSRDAERVSARYGTDVADLRPVAEQLAFMMTAEHGLGLSPTRARLVAAFADAAGGPDCGQKGPTREGALHRSMDALEYIKLGRTEGADQSGDARTFSFAHRRFQEYFATSYTIRSADQVAPAQLLSDGRWRETAVTLLQLQPQRAAPLLAEAERELRRRVPKLGHPTGKALRTLAARSGRYHGRPFTWPEGVLHLLALLQEGTASEASSLPGTIESTSGALLARAYVRGELHDRKWALEVVGTAGAPVRTALLRAAFQSRSEWLHDAAYRQAGRLPEIPPDLARAIRTSLVRMVGSRTLRKQRLTERAELLRLPRPRPYLRALTLLGLAPLLDLALHAVCLATLLAEPPPQSDSVSTLLFIAFAGLSHASVYEWARTLGGAQPLRVRVRRLKRPLAVRFRVLRYWGFTFPVLLRVQFLAARVLLPLVAIAMLAVDASASRIGFVGLALYTSSWGVGALVAAVRARWTHPAAWLIAPVAVLEVAGKAIRRIKINLRVVLTLARAFLAYGLVLLLIYLLGTVLSPGLAAAVSIGMPLLLLSLFAYAIATTLVRDWLWYWSWRRNRPDRFDGQEFLDTLSARRSAGGATRLVAALRADRLAHGNADAQRLLSDLARAARLAAAPSRPAAGHPNAAGWASPAFAAWMSSDLDARYLLLATFGAAFRDELGRLVEDLSGYPGGERASTA